MISEKYSHLISRLSSVYSSLVNGFVTLPMRVFLMLNISILYFLFVCYNDWTHFAYPHLINSYFSRSHPVYTFLINAELFNGHFVYTLYNHTRLFYAIFIIGLGLLPVGLLSPENVDGDRVLILARVSSVSQTDNTSMDTQLEALKEAAANIDATIIDQHEATESASDIERDQLDAALNMAKNDEYDILMIYQVDRLSRADPWDTLKYLYDLQQSGITLYCDSRGYIDWTDHYDFEILSREAVFSNRWLNRIHRGRIEGVKRKLNDGEWAMSDKPPLGYTIDDDRVLKLDEVYAEFLPDIFEIYRETENKSETQRQINNRLEEAGIDTVSKSQIDTILSKQLVLGRVMYAGELVDINRDLQVIDKALFQEVQKILSDQSRQTESVSKPEFLQDAVERFGFDFVTGLMDSFKPFRCRKCDGNFERHGSEEVIGVDMPAYACQSDDCNHQGPLITEDELQKLHQALPLRCPYCTATEEFEVTEIREAGTEFDYEYTCDICEISFGCNMKPDRLERMINHPELKFSINKTTEGKSKDGCNSNGDNSQRSIGYFN